MGPLKCTQCGTTFMPSEDLRKKYPNWKPPLCQSCYRGTKGKGGPELNLTTQEVLVRFDGGPNTGIFTDGSCERNPGGRGGWGVVKVVGNEIITQLQGHSETTTNNAMELTALINGLNMVDRDEQIDVYTDSTYCCNIAGSWAAKWKRLGWKRNKKGEEVLNLDLVKELYELTLIRPRATVRWTRAHDGSLWNEYADSLSTAYTRNDV